MNETLETIRGSWIMRDRETAEASRNILPKSIDQIPADLREKLLSVIEWAERIEQSSDVILDGSARDSVRHVEEIMFLEAKIKALIRVTKDVDSIRALRVTARETIERTQERKAHVEATCSPFKKVHFASQDA